MLKDTNLSTLLLLGVLLFLIYCLMKQPKVTPSAELEYEAEENEDFQNVKEENEEDEEEEEDDEGEDIIINPRGVHETPQ